MVLQGLRVLDFSRYVAGPYCAAMLADLGAEVIRIERPGGNEDRYVCPVTEAGEGTLFLHCNRNKLGITLDPAAPAGRDIVRRLVATADIIVANMPESSLRALGIDYESLRAIRPDIILTMQTGFGRTGPYADRVGFDGVAQAMSGATALSGEPGRPVKSYATWTDAGTAMASAFATLAAVLHRERTGEGQCVESDLLRAALSMVHQHNMEEYFTGIGRQPTANRSQQAAPADLFHASDGAFHIQVVGHGLFKRWCRMIGDEALLDDPRFQTDPDRAAHGKLLSERMQLWCANKTLAEVITALDSARIPGGPLLTPATVFADPHIQTMIEPVDYPGLPRPAPMIGAAFAMSAIPTAITRRPPTLGEHNALIYGALGISSEEQRELANQGVI